MGKKMRPIHKKNKSHLLLCLLFFAASSVYGQVQPPKKITFKDSLDGAFDLSDFLISAHGLIVMPTIITEPALGNFGGAVVPIFLKKLPPVIDTINGERRVTQQAPDLTGGIAMYTANNSWMGGAFRSGTFQKAKIKYRVFSAYADINMSFYKQYENVGEKEFEFNFEMIPLYLSVMKQFKNIEWSAGLQYMFMHSTATANGDLPDFVTQRESTTLVSQIGPIVQFDHRDNIFSPDKGVRLEVDFLWSDEVIGSDFNSWLINYSGIGYIPLSEKIIGGLRVEGTQSLGDPAFFLKPYVSLRGVPVMRYQGDATVLAETEFRWDLYRRWSAVFYAGLGSAYDDWDELFEKPVVYNYGTGFRYLIARKFKLRVGMDIARGPEDWAYYIVFGSSWFR